MVTHSSPGVKPSGHRRPVLKDPGNKQKWPLVLYIYAPGLSTSYLSHIVVQPPPSSLCIIDHLHIIIH